MTKRKDGRWQETYYETGMEKPKYFYSSERTERKANEDIFNQIEKFKKELHRSKHNFKELCEQAIEEKENEKIRFKTLESYNNAFKKLKSLYEYDIEEITPQMIENIFSDMVSKKYGYSSIHKVKVLCGLVYNYGVRKGLNINNFIRELKIPKNAYKGKVHSPDDQVIDFIKKNSETTKFGLWCLFLLATGTRRGEANAIQVKDINFTIREIPINKSTEFQINKAIVEYHTKTECSMRTVPLLDILYEPLKKRCNTLKPNDYIFGGKEPLTKSAIRYNLEKYKKACGFNFTNHQLRHAYAKLLWLAGVDVKTAQGLLGHSSIEITMDIYTDFDKSMNIKAANKVNELLNTN